MQSLSDDPTVNGIIATSRSNVMIEKSSLTVDRVNGKYQNIQKETSSDVPIIISDNESDNASLIMH